MVPHSANLSELRHCFLYLLSCESGKHLAPHNVSSNSGYTTLHSKSGALLPLVEIDCGSNF